MNQDFTVKKKQYLSEKKIRAEGFTWKKNAAQAVSEKKNSCMLKILLVKYAFYYYYLVSERNTTYK